MSTFREAAPRERARQDLPRRDEEATLSARTLEENDALSAAPDGVALAGIGAAACGPGPWPAGGAKGEAEFELLSGLSNGVAARRRKALRRLQFFMRDLENPDLEDMRRMQHRGLCFEEMARCCQSQLASILAAYLVDYQTVRIHEYQRLWDILLDVFSNNCISGEFIFGEERVSGSELSFIVLQEFSKASDLWDSQRLSFRRYGRMVKQFFAMLDAYNSVLAEPACGAAAIAGRLENSERLRKLSLRQGGSQNAAVLLASGSSSGVTSVDVAGEDSCGVEGVSDGGKSGYDVAGLATADVEEGDEAVGSSPSEVDSPGHGRKRECNLARSVETLGARRAQTRTESTNVPAVHTSGRVAVDGSSSVTEGSGAFAAREEASARCRLEGVDEWESCEEDTQATEESIAATGLLITQTPETALLALQTSQERAQDMMQVKSGGDALVSSVLAGAEDDGEAVSGAPNEVGRERKQGESHPALVRGVNKPNSDVLRAGSEVGKFRSTEDGASQDVARGVGDGEANGMDTPATPLGENDALSAAPDGVALGGIGAATCGPGPWPAGGGVAKNNGAAATARLAHSSLSVRAMVRLASAVHTCVDRAIRAPVGFFWRAADAGVTDALWNLRFCYYFGCGAANGVRGMVRGMACQRNLGRSFEVPDARRSQTRSEGPYRPDGHTSGRVAVDGSSSVAEGSSDFAAREEASPCSRLLAREEQEYCKEDTQATEHSIAATGSRITETQETALLVQKNSQEIAHCVMREESGGGALISSVVDAEEEGEGVSGAPIEVDPEMKHAESHRILVRVVNKRDSDVLRAVIEDVILRLTEDGASKVVARCVGDGDADILDISYLQLNSFRQRESPGITLVSSGSPVPENVATVAGGSCRANSDGGGWSGASETNRRVAGVEMTSAHHKVEENEYLCACVDVVGETIISTCRDAEKVPTSPNRPGIVTKTLVEIELDESFPAEHQIWVLDWIAGLTVVLILSRHCRPLGQSAPMPEFFPWFYCRWQYADFGGALEAFAGHRFQRGSIEFDPSYCLSLWPWYKRRALLGTVTNDERKYCAEEDGDGRRHIHLYPLRRRNRWHCKRLWRRARTASDACASRNSSECGPPVVCSAGGSSGGSSGGFTGKSGFRGRPSPSSLPSSNDPASILGDNVNGTALDNFEPWTLEAEKAAQEARIGSWNMQQGTCMRNMCDEGEEEVMGETLPEIDKRNQDDVDDSIAIVHFTEEFDENILERSAATLPVSRFPVRFPQTAPEPTALRDSPLTCQSQLQSTLPRDGRATPLPSDSFDDLDLPLLDILYSSRQISPEYACSRGIQRIGPDCVNDSRFDDDCTSPCLLGAEVAPQYTVARAQPPPTPQPTEHSATPPSVSPETPRAAAAIGSDFDRIYPRPRRMSYAEYRAEEIVRRVMNRPFEKEKKRKYRKKQSPEKKQEEQRRNTAAARRRRALRKHIPTASKAPQSSAASVPRTALLSNPAQTSVAHPYPQTVEGIQAVDASQVEWREFSSLTPTPQSVEFLTESVLDTTNAQQRSPDYLEAWE